MGPVGGLTELMNLRACPAQSHENAWVKGTCIALRAQIGASAPEQSVPTLTGETPRRPDTWPGMVCSHLVWTDSTVRLMCGPQPSKRSRSAPGTEKSYTGDGVARPQADWLISRVATCDVDGDGAVLNLGVDGKHACRVPNMAMQRRSRTATGTQA
jgi:hypothetical protein